ncbi:iron ABC transporter permease [Rhodobacteraceae bacterium]|nr:iron ABC transporter permease [Paracoccaceae bacterium]
MSRLRAALIAALIALVCVLSLMIGAVHIGPCDLWRGLIDNEGPAAFTVRVLRAPRLLCALGAGAALGLSGTIFQMLLRNPLAAPDVMGFNAGAGFAVIVAISTGVNWPMPLVAAMGGGVAAVLVAALSYRRGRMPDNLTLILVGLGVGFSASGLSTLLGLRLPDTLAAEAQRWITGSLSARSWTHVAQIWGLGAVLCAMLVVQVRGLGLLQLGPALAAGLGLHLGRSRAGLLATAVLLAACGVAVAGPVPFVALMAGPLGIAITRARGPAARLLAGAGSGALITAAADLLARALWLGVQLPVGVMTGLLGAPYLLWFLSRAAKEGTL